MKPNVFLIGDTSDRHNWGCRATTFQLRSMIEERGTIVRALDTRHLGSKLEPTTADTRVAPSRPVVAKAGAFKAAKSIVKRGLFEISPGRISQSPDLGVHISPRLLPTLAKRIYDRKIFPNIADAIEESDVVIVNGEGSMMQNRAVGKFKLLFAYAAKVAFSKPTAIVNHTADFRNQDFMDLARVVYPVLDDAVFREKLSFQNGEKLRGNKPFALAADAAFRFQTRKWPEEFGGEIQPAYGASVRGVIDTTVIRGFDPSAPYLTVGGSSAFMGKARGIESAEASFRSLVTQLMDIGQVVITASSTPDHFILKGIADEFSLPYFGLDTDVQQAVDVLGNSSVYVGGRWHPGIMALTGGTPVVSLSANSDYKSKGLVDLAGLEQVPISVEEMDSSIDLIVKMARHYIARGADLREKISSIAESLSQDSLRNVEILSRGALARRSAA